MMIIKRFTTDNFKKGYTTITSELANKRWQEKNDFFMKRTKGGQNIMCVIEIIQHDLMPTMP